MRIVQLTDQYLPSIGGTERHVAKLSGALAGRGHEVTVVTMARPGLPAHEHDANGVAVVRIDAPELALLRRFYQNPNHSFHPPLPLLGTRRALARAIGAVGADVVHGHNWLTYPYLTVADRVPVVHTIHDRSGVCPKMTLIERDGSVCTGPAVFKCSRCATGSYPAPVAAAVSVALRGSRRLHGRIDATLAVSDPVNADQAWAFPDGIETVSTFVPDHLADVVARAERPGFVPAGPYLLFVGGLSHHKGIDVALDAYRMLRTRLGDAAPALLLVGVVKHDTPTIDLDGVHVVTDVAHDQVMAAWRYAAAGIVPSRSEAWGQVVAEALTAGCPVVVSDRVGLAATVAAHDAGLVAPVDSTAFADALGAILADPDAAQARAERGRSVARRLTVSSVVGELERIYAEVVARRRAARTGR